MDTKGISKLDLKRRNRKQILLAIRQSGMLARVDIAAQLSLTRAAVTIITNQMIAQNILEDMNGPLPDAADQPKKKGRKKTMIRINPNYKYVLGAIIDEECISVGISNLANEVIGQCYKEIDDSTEPDEIISFIVTSCRELLKKHNLNNKQILGLGVGVIPSRSAQLRGEFKKGEVCYEKLGYLLEMELSVPVQTASAISLYALANIDYSDMAGGSQLLVYSGQSYYSALIVGHEIIGGCSKDPSAISRAVACMNGIKKEGYPDGSVHAEISRPALIEKVAAVKGEKLTIEQINDLYTAGDPDVTPIIETLIDRFVFLIYNYATLSSASRVTLQSFRFCEKAFDYLQRKLSSLTGDSRRIKLVFSGISGKDTFLAGSALAVERQFFDLGGMLPGETGN